MQIFRQKNAKKNTIFHTLKNRAKIEKKMQENYEKLYISFGNVVQMVLPIIKGRGIMVSFFQKGRGKSVFLFIVSVLKLVEN